MSFKGILEIEGNEYDVLDCQFGFNRSVDEKGQPSEEARGGIITISIEGTGDTTFYDWMIDNWGIKSGKIKFLKRDSDATEVELSFKEAYCVGWNLGFSAANSTRPTIENIVVSTQELTYGGNTISKNWKM